MADGVDIDLYADDLEPDFATNQDEFGPDGVDLYDDVIATPASDTPLNENNGSTGGGMQIDRVDSNDTNGVYQVGNNLAPNHIGRRHQLYVGNLNWWTTDQDITDAVHDLGVNDFQEVKFFENRSNGQSKGFCVISLGSETSMRLCLDRLQKKEIHGQAPVVTLPSKQALNQFESQQKTRPVPPTQNGPRGPIPNMSGGPQQHPMMPPQGQPRMMNPGQGPPNFRPHMPPQNMQGPPGQNQGPPRMQQPPMHQGKPMGGPQMQQGPPRFPNQQWNNGPPRPNGPIRPGPPGPPGSQQHRPQMFQGPPGPGGMPRGGPRPDWNRPPMHGGFPQGPPGPGPQGPPHMQGPPRGPPPQMGGPGPHGPPQGPAPHVNPAFFNQSGGPGSQHPSGPPIGPPHQGPQPNMNMQPHGPPHFGQQNQPRGPWPGPQNKPSGPMFPDQNIPPQLSENEFEEIMARNRTVSSSAIARAVSDAAAGENSSAIETLVTAISLIKQSKVAHDERCKILITSLQDTLHGIEAKSYNRRDRSRSRDRSHRRGRRERSTSRYRERSRERERERDRDRDRDGRYYNESYRDGRGEQARDRSRSRDRSGNNEHYRDDGRSGRPRKSPDVAGDQPGESNKRSGGGGGGGYYDERYRSSDRERDRDRDREREHRTRH